MQNITLLLLYSLFLTNLLKLLLITSAENVLLHTVTSIVTTFNSTYISNLRELASFLREKASAEGYSESLSKLLVYVPPVQVSGVVLCRGDVNVSYCTDCIDQAAYNAVVWYDYCLFQYSNYEPISPTDNSLRFVMWNDQNFAGSEFKGWDQSYDAITFSIKSTLSELLTNVSQHAAFNSTKRFATGMTINKTIIASSSTARLNQTATLPEIYGLSQCIPSFSNNTCHACLQDRFDKFLGSYDGSKGGRIVGVKCNLRYEIYPFFFGNPDIQLSSVLSTEILPPTPSDLPPSWSPPPSSQPPSVLLEICPRSQLIYDYFYSLCY
ncbi:hypothetical protein LUZ63_000730 [Rhynchospora breviuscula]|uniref:Gnk2-homologous domain-containing protein n=1 Tax=Rhynchospora breviuscula TaxID=2022672 RepID=A0A9Q0CVQ7_9POAL|nr:hypothetical protein LUZ63_000730 [Rhynchospora breviuscula]